MLKYAFLPQIERKYQIQYELSPLAIILLDQEARIHDANPAALQLFDLTLNAIRQCEFSTLLSPRDEKLMVNPIESVLLKTKVMTGEYLIKKAKPKQRMVMAESEYIVIDGKPFQYVILRNNRIISDDFLNKIQAVLLFLLRNVSEVIIRLFLRDITQSREAEQKITFMAYHDELTGLANRVMFQQKLASALEQQSTNHRMLAVMLMDLDRFKLINDTKGHQVGDLLLKYVAGQLVAHAPKNMVIARLGGDEFTLFVPDMKKWIEAGFDQLVVSVNISPCQFRNQDFTSELKHILEQTQLAPNKLCLESTESTALENQEHSMEVCRQIVEMQVGLSIDDFGTGYSSFSLLKYLKFDTIKIDRSFVKDMQRDDEDAVIVNAIVAMAHSLKQKVVAEGVEEKEQWELLQGIGCDRVQGFYISEAIPADLY